MRHIKERTNFFVIRLLLEFSFSLSLYSLTDVLIIISFTDHHVDE